MKYPWRISLECNHDESCIIESESEVHAASQWFAERPASGNDLLRVGECTWSGWRYTWLDREYVERLCEQRSANNKAREVVC